MPEVRVGLSGKQRILVKMPFGINSFHGIPEDQFTTCVHVRSESDGVKWVRGGTLCKHPVSPANSQQPAGTQKSSVSPDQVRQSR